MKRALLSVSDKTGLLDFASALVALGYALISTGGTAASLAAAGIAVRKVSEVTGFPEIMGGRVKTLHPRIHGALLARAGIDDDVLAEHDIAPIDLLVLNLYPFAQTVANPDSSADEVIEQIDIGGPAMLRAAAKNHARVTVVVDPADYLAVLIKLRQGVNLADRQRYAAKAFAHVAQYDAGVAQWLQQRFADDPVFPPTLHPQLSRRDVLRYGENPHQAAAVYVEPGPDRATVLHAQSLQGKELSFNNLADADAALACVQQFERPACVIVKHMNPCGVAVADDLWQAYDAAYATDPVSAFGGIIACNRKVDEKLAQEVLSRQFVEVFIAPFFSAEALVVLATKPNIRVLATGSAPITPERYDYRRVQGGFLVQEADIEPASRNDRVVSARQPTPAQWRDLQFAWQVASFVKSNAIVYAAGGRTIGVGAGQMSRVISARIAGMKAAEAGLTVAGAVMASDAFFPFRDGIDAAHAAGIRAVIQPGGSIRDAEIIAAADEHDMAMVFTGIRHFRH